MKYTVEIVTNYIDEQETYQAVFEQGMSVCQNKIIERLRSLGYEVYSFGKNNRKYPDNFTGTFIEE